MTEFNRI